jgi:hypothetical protein
MPRYYPARFAAAQASQARIFVNTSVIAIRHRGGLSATIVHARWKSKAMYVIWLLEHGTLAAHRRSVTRIKRVGVVIVRASRAMTQSEKRITGN